MLHVNLLYRLYWGCYITASCLQLAVSFKRKNMNSQLAETSINNKDGSRPTLIFSLDFPSPCKTTPGNDILLFLRQRLSDLGICAPSNLTLSQRTWGLLWSSHPCQHMSCHVVLLWKRQHVVFSSRLCSVLLFVHSRNLCFELKYHVLYSSQVICSHRATN